MRTFLFGASIVESEEKNGVKPSKEELEKLYRRIANMSDEEVRMEYHRKRV
jgi:hypothetical protein